MNFVTPKAAAKHELLFNKPASVMLPANDYIFHQASLLNKSSCLAPACGVTKSLNCQKYYFGHTLL
jgi:hypothetical protein